MTTRVLAGRPTAAVVALLLVGGATLPAPLAVRGLLTVAGTLAGLAWVLVGMRRHRPGGPVWPMLAASLALDALCTIAWHAAAIVGSGETLGAPSLADAGWIGANVLAAAALVYALVGRERPLVVTLDVAAIAAGVGLVVGVVLIGPDVAANHLSTAMTLALVSCAVVDVVLISAVLRLLVTPAGRPPALWLLAGAVTALVTSDVLWNWLTVSGDYVPHGWTESGWHLFPLLVGLAALSPSMTKLGRRRGAEGGELAASGPLLLGGASLVAPLLLGLHAFFPVVPDIGHDQVSGTAVMTTGAVISALVVTRFGLLLRRAQQLMRTSEQALAERVELIRQHELRSRTLVDAIQQGVFILDAAGRLADVSDRLCEMTGFSREELVGTSEKPYWPPEYADELRAARDAAQAAGAGTFETVLRRKDGQRFPARIEVRRLADADGGMGIMGVVRDRTEEARTIEDARIRARLLDEVDAAVVATDLEGKVTHWNGGAARLYGRPQADALGRPIAEVISEQDSTAPAASVLEAVLATGRWDGELAIQAKDGRSTPVHLTASLIEDDRGTAMGVVGVSVDISGRVEAERELRAARDYLRAVTDSMGEGLCAVDRNGRIAFVNQAAEELLGWTQEELHGRLLHETVHFRHADGSPYPVAECSMIAARVGEAVVRVEDDLFIRKDGSGLAVSYTSAPIVMQDGAHGAVVVFTDISERKRQRAMAERRESEQRLGQKLEAVGELAAGIAHEINTPIQFVGDTVHFLRDAFIDVMALVDAQVELCRAAETGTVDAEILGRVRDAEALADVEYLADRVPGAFERAEDGIRRVATIVRAMREFAHPATGDHAPADLNQAVGNTLVVAANAYKYVADVETDLAELPQVLCNVGDVNQVLLNLIVNAAHAIEAAVGESSERGTIRIRTRHVDDGVVISVSDTGCGIPPEIADRIFDPFFTTKDVGRGTGQGLSIARTMVVERHSGSLTFETELGRGTTFHVRLPVAGVLQEATA